MSRAERLLNCVDQMLGLDDPTQLPMALAEPLGKLIPYDFLVYNEINTASGAITTVSEPLGVEGGNAAFEEYADQHPLLTHYQKTGDPNVLRLSDHISRAEFHRLELYKEFLGHFGIEHQIVCTVPAVRTIAIGLVLTRQRHDFSGEECDLLARLRPYVINAYRAARKHAEVDRRLRTFQDALGATGHAVIELDRSGEITACSTDADRLLIRYGAGRAETVCRLLGQRQSVTLARNGDHLLVTRAGRALLLDEKIDPLAPDRLRSLGLSAREAQVLRGVADGAPNKAIAAGLGITARTVKKHLERIYEKLGVDSRTAAVARVRTGYQYAFDRLS